MRNILAAIVIQRRNYLCCEPDNELSGDLDVVSVGDTDEKLIGNGTYTIPLNGFETVESGRSFDAKSKKAWSRLGLDRQFRVEKQERDRFGRVIGLVVLKGKDVNARMIKIWWVSHIGKFIKEKAYAILEFKVTFVMRSLWQDETSISFLGFCIQRKQGDNKPPNFISKCRMNSSHGTRYNQSGEHFAMINTRQNYEATEGKPFGICSC